MLAVVLTMGALLLGTIIMIASPSSDGKAVAAVTGQTRLPKVVQGFNEQIAGNITISEDTTGQLNGRDLWLRVAPTSTTTARGVIFSQTQTITASAATTGTAAVGTPRFVGEFVHIPVTESTPTTGTIRQRLDITVSGIRYDVGANASVGTVTVEVYSSETTPTTTTALFGSAANARVVASATLFPDIRSDQPGFFAAPAISYLRLRDVIDGYPDGTFKPELNITRAEFVKMVVEVRGLTLPTTFTAPFPDVPVNDWSARYVAAAKAAGIAMGYANGQFRPDRSISRAEIAAFVVRAGGFTINTGGTRFPDVSQTHWAFNEIMTARNNGIVSGFADGTYRPNTAATRAEAAVIIFNWSD